MREDKAKEFNKWRNKVKKRLPDAAQRVFALRNKAYMGCGFHYALEKQLGYVILSMNDHNKYWNFAEMVVCKVCTTGFFRDLAKAEKSAGIS